MKSKFELCMLLFFAVVGFAMEGVVAQETLAEESAEVKLISADNLSEKIATHTLVVVDNGEKEIVQWTGEEVPADASALIEKYDLHETFEAPVMKKKCSSASKKECQKGMEKKECSSAGKKKCSKDKKKCCKDKKSSESRK